MVKMLHINLELRELPEAERLADLAGVETDLKACASYAEAELARKPVKTNFATEVREAGALTIAALTAYGRCFKGGVRSRTQRELEASISAEDLSRHEMIIALRDTFIAHSVNDLERHRLRIWMFPPGSREAIWGVTIESDQMVSPPAEIFRSMIDLCKKHLAWVEAETQKEAKILKSLVKIRYSIEQLYALGPTQSPRLDFRNLKRSRKRS